LVTGDKLPLSMGAARPPATNPRDASDPKKSLLSPPGDFSHIGAE
jgi:hypothetical protein